MALKDCKFFADINGRQVEMDFDQFRAYLLQDNVMATLAPDLTGKRGKKAGFTLTAQKAETAAVKTEESKGGVYPFTEHKKAVQVINSFKEGEFITNGTIIAVKSAISPKALSRIKSAEQSKLRPVSKAIHDTWVNRFVKDAKEKASIAGVWQVDKKTSMALLQAENVIVPVDANQLKALYNLVQFDGVKVDYRDIANAAIVTKNGQPVGAISPFNMKAMEQEHQITLETLRDVLKKPQSKAPVVPVKAKAVTTKAEATATKAEAPSENVVTVTAEPADAQRIADSVKTQKPDAQGFTKPQRTYLVEKAKEVYKEAQEASKSTKFVIKVPGDGQFTVKTPTEANSLHRRLTGDNVPGVDAKDTKVKREVLNPTKKTGLVETVAIGKAGDMKTPAFRWALQATAPSPARFKPFSRGLFTAKDKKGEFETKGSGAYPIELHEGSSTVENILPSGDYITDGYMLVLRSAVTPASLKKVKLGTSQKNTPNLEGVKHAWDKSVKDASVPAEIAGVFQSEAEKGVALIDGPKGIIALNPDLVKSVLDLVKPDGVMVTPDSVEEAVIFTKNGKPVGAVQPFRGSSYKEGELEAALAFTKQESTSRPTLPLSAESLRKVQPSLSKDRAEALIQVLKAMGLPFDRIKLAKGETGGKGTLKQEGKQQQAALDASPSAEVREAAKKWAGVKEIKPAVNSQLSALVNELEQLRGNIERSLYKKSIDELIAMDPIMQMSFGSQDAYPVQMHGRLKAAIVGYYSHLFVEPTSEFAYNHYSEQWGVPKADLVRQADITTLIYPNQDPFVKEEAEQRSGISKKSLLERGREAFKTGQPVLVETYHGSGASGIQGNRFNASLAGKTTGAGSAQRGYFFAGSKYTAESYLGQAAYALDPANYTNLTQGILYKFFVKMSNPFVYDMKGNEWREETFASIMDRAKAAGHDGVIFTNTYDGGGLDNIFTLFHGHENQIKSANPNTYDDQGKLIPKSERFQAETPDIRYQAQAYHATRGLFAPEPGFPNGRFRLDKVNTGLGAQSFGHGIYIAEGKAGVTAYTEMLEEDAPGSVVYELDVPDGIVAKLAIYEKPLTPNQFAALKSQVQSTLGEKGSQAIAGLNRANTGDLIERIQDAIDGEDAGRQTSEIFSKAGIPGVKVEVSKDFGENKSFYVIWNQAALDRIALMKANEKPLQTALEPIKQEEEAPPLGSIEFIDDLNAVISTFEGSNESTILHEGFHFYRRHMLNEANGFTQAEVGQFNDWAGAKGGVWTVAAEEKAARGFEKYLRTGLAPIPELKKLFQKVAKWLREVYKTLQGSEIDIEIPDNIRRIFDRIFTLEAERQKGATGTVQAETSARTLQQSNVKARDAEYMAAVKAGNTAKAQKMVDAAAKAAGYNTPKLYHGTPSRFNVFDASKIGINGRMLGPGFYFTTDKDTALGYTGQGGRVVTAYARSKKPLPYSSKPFNASQMQKLLTSIALIEANSEPGGNWRDGFLSGYVYTYGVSLEAAVKEASRAFLNEEKALDQLGGIIGSGADPANVNQGLKASLGYDSYTATGYENRGFGGGDIYVLMESEQVKSADPITYDDKGNVIPLSKRFEPSTPDIRYQKASTGPARLKQEKEGKGAPGEPSATDVFRQKQAEARRKAAEAAMNRLRQATKEGQAKQASPASTTTTPPPKAAPSQPKAPKPSPSRPSTAGAPTGASGQAGTSKPKVRKTIEQEVKDAIDRARKGKANPNNLPLDERLQRSIRGFADRFARRMVEAEAANIYQPDITLPDGSVVDRQEHFEDSLHDYAKAFLANDADGVTKIRAVLEKILPERPPKPKVQKTAAERIKAAIERAERAANRKAASLTVEERIDREVKAFADRFAKRMVWAKKAGTYTDDVILPDGTVVDRQTFFEQAVNDFMTAYQAGNMAGVSLAKSHMNMATEQVPPDVGFGIHSLRSPLSYSNVVGSYEGVMGPLGAEVSTTFKRFHQEVALKQKTMGEALAVLRKVMRENYFPAMRDAGFYGMESIVTSHIDYIQAINNFSQNYRKVQESARLFKNPSKFVKSRLEFAKQANMISGAPQSNGWPMAASFMKAAVYLTKLKFNPKSALMNYSQVFLSAGPYFSPVELVAIIGKSHRPSVRNRVIDGMRLVDVAVRTTGGREVDEGPRKTVWDYLDIFRYSSEQTRVIGYLLGEAMADRIAADRAAKKDPPLLAPQRQEIIRDWIEKIEFDNSPWNVAPFFRERGLKGALFQFKPFVQKNVERLYADIRRNPLDYVSPKSENAFGKAIEKAFPESVRKYTKLIGYQVVIGGVGSVLTAIPVAKPIAGYLIYAGLLALAKSFGDDEEAEKAADAIYYGAPALVGVDLSNSVGYVETPHGKNIYEQLVNEFLGPAVSTTANIATQGAELYAEMNKPTPLGRPEQKAAKVERRVWDIAKAVTPTARPVEMAVTMARGKQPELYLDKPTPLTRGEKIGRFAAFNPLRQSKFFDQKEATDWQKRLAGKVTENPEIKRLEGEPDAKYARRQKMYQSWKPYYTRRMLSEPDFRLLSQEDKDAVLDNLKRNMVEETTKVSPDTDKFDAEEIIKRRLKRRQVED